MSLLPLANGGFYAGSSVFGGLFRATQGPKADPDTVPDLWSWLVEQRATVVLNLTAWAEGGTTKSEDYVPGTAQGVVSDWQGVHVRTLASSKLLQHLGDFGEATAVQLWKAEQPDNVRVVLVVQISSWPSGMLPQDGDSLAWLSLFCIRADRSLRQQRGQPDPGLVVHCSSGNGRTGRRC